MRWPSPLWTAPTWLLLACRPPTPPAPPVLASSDQGAAEPAIKAESVAADPGTTPPDPVCADTSKAVERPPAEVCLPAPWTMPAAPDFGAVAQRIEEGMELTGTPGAAMAIAVDGRIVWERGFGWANEKRGVRADAHTAFSVASTTKPFTATAVMMLVEQGKVELDAPANRYLPGRGIWEGEGNAADATVRLLLAHRAGLPTHARFFMVDASAPAPSPSEAASKHAMMASPPNERRVYSNLGFGILGEIVASVSGITYAEFLRSALFAPLALVDSSIGRPEGRRNTSLRYRPGGDAFPDYEVDHPGASSLYTSVHDLARFGMFQLGQLPESEAILTAESRDAMRVPMDEADRYGLGFGAGRTDGTHALWHDGRMYGVSATLELYPEYGVVFAVVGNTDALKSHFSDIKVRALAALDVPARADQLCELANDHGVFGHWSGTLEIEGQSRPIELEVTPEGDVRIRSSDAEPWRSLRRLSFERGWLQGVFEGDLGLPEGRGSLPLRLELRRRGERMTGTLTSMLIPHGWTPRWVELRRDPTSAESSAESSD